MKKKRITFFCLVLSLWAGVAYANISKEICMGIYLKDTPAKENPSAVANKGEKIREVSQYLYNPKTKKSYYCAHGDYCYDTNSIKLLNCHISKQCDDNDCSMDDEGFIIYKVES